MTEIQDAASWPAYSDGSATTGTPVNAALLDAIAASINELVHDPTNPGITPKDIVAEMILARGGATNLAARLDAITDASGGLKWAAGAAIRKMATSTVNIDPGNITGQTSAETAVTISGLAVGDIVIFEPPASLEAGLIPATVGRVSAADTVQLRLTNVTGGAIDGASRTWRYFWIDLT